MRDRDVAAPPWDVRLIERMSHGSDIAQSTTKSARVWLGLAACWAALAAVGAMFGSTLQAIESAALAVVNALTALVRWQQQRRSQS